MFKLWKGVWTGKLSIYYLYKFLVCLFQKSNLDRHIESGACGKELIKQQCPQCEASFTNKRELERHILKEHPMHAADLMPKVTCTICQKTFPQKEHLDLHKEKGYCEKTGTRHQCPECQKVYKWRKQMFRHVREKHPEKAAPIKPHRLTDVEGKCYYCM